MEGGKGKTLHVVTHVQSKIIYGCLVKKHMYLFNCVCILSKQMEKGLVGEEIKRLMGRKLQAEYMAYMCEMSEWNPFVCKKKVMLVISAFGRLGQENC